MKKAILSMAVIAMIAMAAVPNASAAGACVAFVCKNVAASAPVEPDVTTITDNDVHTNSYVCAGNIMFAFNAGDNGTINQCSGSTQEAYSCNANAAKPSQGGCNSPALSQAIEGSEGTGEGDDTTESAEA